MGDSEVRKVLLYRENAFVVYLSSQLSLLTGAYLTTDYSSLSIYIPVPDCQAFLTRYQEAYSAYRKMTRGQQLFTLTYEEMLSDETRTSKLTDLFYYLGVDSDVTPKQLPKTIQQNVAPLQDSIQNYAEIEFAWRHTQIGKRFLAPPVSQKDSKDSCKPKAQWSTSVDRKDDKWALLLPIRSFPHTLADCCEQLSKMKDALDKTTTEEDRASILLVVGVDSDDLVYNSEAGRQALSSLLGPEYTVVIDVLQGLTGEICKIWNRLGCVAYAHGAHFFCLIGDDVIIETPGWKHMITSTFHELADLTGLPFGHACVAFHDRAFAGFPTFPVVHRRHLDIFEKKVLPSSFVNQGGDPYLFELYSRYGAAKFAEGVYLANTIGGETTDTRYQKQHIRWNDDILSSGILKLDQSNGVGEKSHWLAVDVVVPTYRCELEILRKIVALRSSKHEVLVRFWLIVDNPVSPNLDEVKSLANSSDNYTVHVKVHKGNFGASAARNTGLGYSNADWVVLLDDDVTVGDSLLDAYIGAIMRHPAARVFVGCTHFPAPNGILTHAITSCGLNGSFSISERETHPPWGPTANLCVRGRSSKSRFSLQYPKTGGGEDIDYCLKVSNYFPNTTIAVPGALAHHPWWGGGHWTSLWHFFGWALGESICVESLPQRHLYLSLPNGVETILVLPILIPIISYCLSLLVDTQSCSATSWSSAFSAVGLLIFSFETAWHANDVFLRAHHSLHKTGIKSFWYQCIVAIVSAWLIMFQDFARFTAHCRRGAIHNLFWRIDWLCGSSPTFVTYNKQRIAIRFVLYLSIVIWATAV